MIRSPKGFVVGIAASVLLLGPAVPVGAEHNCKEFFKQHRRFHRDQERRHIRFHAHFDNPFRDPFHQRDDFFQQDPFVARDHALLHVELNRQHRDFHRAVTSHC